MNKEDIEEIKNILRKIEENTRRPSAAMEAKVFNTWLSQYDNDEEVDISEEPPPLPPVAACSNEQLYEANRKWNEWMKKHPWKE